MAKPDAHLVLRPAGEYDRAFFDRLMRTLQLAFDALHDEGPAQFTTLKLTNLPNDGGGLATGQVYNDAGTLKIVIEGIVSAGSVSSTVSVGTVTIVTT